jgi:hypothetical protein
VGRKIRAAALLLLGWNARARASRAFAEPAPFRMPVESASVIERAAGQGRSRRRPPRRLPSEPLSVVSAVHGHAAVLRTKEEFADYLALAKDPSGSTRFKSGTFRIRLARRVPDRYCDLIAHLRASAS